MVIYMNENFSCGGRIKELRTARGLSQERLALSAGITPAYLGLLERGKRNATIVIIERICSAMNLSLAEFFSTACIEKENDKIGNQIICQMVGLSEEEKLLILQIVKSAIDIHQLHMRDKVNSNH